MNWKSYVTLALVGLLGHTSGADVLAASSGVSLQGRTAVFTAPNVGTQLGGETIDYVNAQPLDLPRSPARSDAEIRSDMLNPLMPQQAMGVPGYAPGKAGNGVRNPVDLGAPQISGANDDGITQKELGTNKQPVIKTRWDIS